MLRQLWLLRIGNEVVNPEDRGPKIKGNPSIAALTQASYATGSKGASAVNAANDEFNTEPALPTGTIDVK
jgi:hypothetical protein